MVTYAGYQRACSDTVAFYSKTFAEHVDITIL